jgi:hypothetical protein
MDGAVDLERAAIDRGEAGVAIGAGQDERAGADFDQRRAVTTLNAAVENAAAQRGGEIVAADGELMPRK